MTILYTCRTDGDLYRITKLDTDMNVESSYLCTDQPRDGGRNGVCECPAFERRGKCRHLEMLPRFLERKAINTAWMYDYDQGGWVQGPEQEQEQEPYDTNQTNPLGVAQPAEHQPWMLEDAGSNPATQTKDRPLPPAHYPSWRRI